MTEPLRPWQEKALAIYHQITATKSDCLICASVGGGKTRLACLCSASFLQERHDGEEKRQIIIVTNSRNLIRAWIREGTKNGLKLEAVSDNAQLEKGYSASSDGYVMTYAALGSWPELHASFVAKRPTMVIIDEIHHLEEGEDSAQDSRWCEAAKTALSHAAFRLSLSGTPFRSNGTRIPFVTYEEVQGQAGLYELKPDFNYSYGEAVADGVCRETVFKPYEGVIRYSIRGEEFAATFAEQ